MALPFSGLLRFLGGGKPSEPDPRLGRRLDRVKADRLRNESAPRTFPDPRKSLGDRLAKVKTERERLDRKREDRRANDPEWRYMNLEEWVSTPASSNVAAFRYRQGHQMEVEFNDGSIYLYTGVPPWKALSFYRADSKGGAVWDYLRIRGTELGHQHPYYMLVGPRKGAGKPIAPNFGTRLWETNPKTARRHGRKADKQSGKKRQQ